MNRNYAIVLAGGNGSRMGGRIPKQYMEVCGKPLLCHSLDVFEACTFIDGIVLVVRSEDIDYCRESIINKYGYGKISSVVTGGARRCDSVMNGLSAVRDPGYVFIHDGARPCITPEILDRLYEDVKKYRTAVAAVPSKDTVKISDDDGFVRSTPDRKNTWIIQTPQVFDTDLIKSAYENIDEDSKDIITDDAMVMENYGRTAVKLTLSEYTNIKVTTPEDISIAGEFLNLQKN